MAVANLLVVHVDFQAFLARSQNQVHHIQAAVLDIRAVLQTPTHRAIAFHDQPLLMDPPGDGIQVATVLEVRALHTVQLHMALETPVTAALATPVTVALEMHTGHLRRILEAMALPTEQLRINLATAIAVSVLLMDQRQTISGTAIVALEPIIIIILRTATLVGHQVKLAELQRIQILDMEHQKCQMQAAPLTTLDGIPKRRPNHHIQRKLNIKITQLPQK